MSKNTNGIIDIIAQDSIAEDLGWMPGDEIVSVNGHTLSDLIDYQFHTAEEYLRVIIKRGAETAEFEIEKDIDLDLGITFKDALFDGVRTCGAKCVFCFVDQLPEGLRKSLYLKDDDFRLSFLHSNFVTLANVSDSDLVRIIEQRLSPLYVSVHTTDPALRQMMLGRPSPAILDQIDVLAKGGITLHTQVVLCRNLNDSEKLDRTISELGARYPYVKSIAIVPAGLTPHRRHKKSIPPIDAQYSADILDNIRRWQRRFKSEYGTRLVWAADEFYLCAGKAVPVAAAYEGFPQIGNGIGLVRKFQDSAYRAKRILSALPSDSAKKRISVATGTLAAPVITKWAATFTDKIKTKVYPIENRLFGDTVTVAGLMAGRDIIDQLRGKQLGDLLVIPSIALRDDTFLDDVKLVDVETALNTRVASSYPSPTAFIRLITSL